MSCSRQSEAHADTAAGWWGLDVFVWELRILLEGGRLRAPRMPRVGCPAVLEGGTGTLLKQ